MANQPENNIAPLDTFDHVVVLMLENRSFDNLLGYLYTDDVPEGKTFEGLYNYHKEMPIPSRAVDYNEHKSVPIQTAKDFNQPFPDPGEVYQHVNTQLYNHVDCDNVNVKEEDMVSPYNIPNPLPTKDQQMLGFVNDYINTLQAIQNKKYPQYDHATYDLYKVIMQVYEPTQVSVLSTLAKEFAVFDHWFCAVPSQTWCNRAFWHAATSGGQVINPMGDKGTGGKIEGMYDWAKDVWSKKTLFELMKDVNKTHGIYTENPVALTTLVNGPFKSEHVVHTGDKLKGFKDHVESGNLPHYSFIEPKFLGQHNDQHPSSLSGLIDGPTKTGTVLLGENLIWDVYNTIFTSEQYKDNTLLIITYDEHGGCFDHVVPGPATPPEPNINGQKGCKFDRLGVRVPMVMVSAYIEQNTIMNEKFQHTSFLHTMCKKWGMPTLTNRDPTSRTFEKVFSTRKRDFPSIPAHIIPESSDADYENDKMNDLQKSILVGAAYLASENAKRSNTALDVSAIETVETVGEAMRFIEAVKEWL